jgi:hypothetical protein
MRADYRKRESAAYWGMRSLFSGFGQAAALKVISLG